MELLENRIKEDAAILSQSVLKIDDFLSNYMDTELITNMAKEWKRTFITEGVTKILTIEGGGLGIAAITGAVMGVPVILAKKTRNAVSDVEYYTAKVVSYTHGNIYTIYVPKRYISEGDVILIVDDLLANGSALRALISIVEASEARFAGAGIAVEKVFSGGGNDLRSKGYKVESLAKVARISDVDGIVFE